MTSLRRTQQILLNIEVLLGEMEHYRRTGNRTHLAHAARAIDEMRADLDRMLRARAVA